MAVRRTSICGGIILNEGSSLPCCVCGISANNAVDPGQIAEIIAPIIRHNFEIEVSRNGRDCGAPLIDVIATVIGRHLDCLEEVENALLAMDKPIACAGGDTFFRLDESYVRRRGDYKAMIHKWKSVEQELKHQQRFFSHTAQSYFKMLFARVDEYRDGLSLPVVLVYHPGTELFRARAIANITELDTICQSAATELGPPPGELAPAGRMNASGVSVFYGAFDTATCFAEMRPSLASHVLIGTFKTTQTLRVLDFSALAQSGPEKLPSFFDPELDQKQEAAEVLRIIHGLISRPVQPGAESSEYIITQSVAEYLAYAQNPPLDGVIFNSVQRAGGKNIVLFSQFGRGELLQDDYSKCFPIEYLDGSVQLFKTKAIKYESEEFTLSEYGGRYYADYHKAYRDDEFPYDV